MSRVLKVISVNYFEECDECLCYQIDCNIFDNGSVIGL